VKDHFNHEGHLKYLPPLNPYKIISVYIQLYLLWEYAKGGVKFPTLATPLGFPNSWPIIWMSIKRPKLYASREAILI